MFKCFRYVAPILGLAALAVGSPSQSSNQLLAVHLTVGQRSSYLISQNSRTVFGEGDDSRTIVGSSDLPASFEVQSINGGKAVVSINVVRITNWSASDLSKMRKDVANVTVDTRLKTSAGNPVFQMIPLLPLKGAAIGQSWTAPIDVAGPWNQTLIGSFRFMGVTNGIAEAAVQVNELKTNGPIGVGTFYLNAASGLVDHGSLTLEFAQTKTKGIGGSEVKAFTRLTATIESR